MRFVISETIFYCL